MVCVRVDGVNSEVMPSRILDRSVNVKRALTRRQVIATAIMADGKEASFAESVEVGQPVLIPGSMGTASYVLTGVRGGHAFHSTCHGAGRRLSRHQAARTVSPKVLRDELERRQGILVRGASQRGLAEEAPVAYKDVDEVVAVAEQAGLCRRVARLVPLGVVKG